ncbi:MAG: helix-turn-helix domain-containing protein [Endozoicomonadaceae bacterium]|nr:helix-turn-helix domain-containing protein [Endozoicomonadaceae bacterium]
MRVYHNAKPRKKRVALSAEKKAELCRLAPEMTYNQLRKHFNVSENTITRILKRNSISLSGTTSRLRQFDILKMCRNGKKICEIATSLGFSQSYVRRVIKRYNSGNGYFPENKTTNNPGSSKTEEPTVRRRKKSVELSAEKEAELCRLAPEMDNNLLIQYFNISDSTITKILKRNGINLSKTTSKLRDFNIFKMHTNGKKVREIAKLLNLSKGHVRRIIGKYRHGNGHFPENKTTNNPGSSETKNLL